MYVSSATPTTTTDRSGTGKVTIDVLPDDTLLEIFVLYQGDNEYFTTKNVENAGARMPKMEICHLCIAPAFALAPCLRCQNTCHEATGYLAGLAYHHTLFAQGR